MGDSQVGPQHSPRTKALSALERTKMHLTRRACARPGDQDKVRLGLKGVKTGEKDGHTRFYLEQGSLR